MTTTQIQGRDAVTRLYAALVRRAQEMREQGFSCDTQEEAQAILAGYYLTLTGTPLPDGEPCLVPAIVAAPASR